MTDETKRNRRKPGTGSVRRLPSGNYRVTYTAGGITVPGGVFKAEADAHAAASDVDRKVAHLAAAQRKAETPPLFVYFMQGESGGPIKIGKTTDVDARRAGVQTGHPDLLRVLAVVSGELDEEKRLHLRFRKSRLKGEWFKPTPDLLAHIAAATLAEAGRKSARSMALVARLRAVADQIERALTESAPLPSTVEPR